MARRKKSEASETKAKRKTWKEYRQQLQQFILSHLLLAFEFSSTERRLLSIVMPFQSIQKPYPPNGGVVQVLIVALSQKEAFSEIFLQDFIKMGSDCISAWDELVVIPWDVDSDGPFYHGHTPVKFVYSKLGSSIELGKKDAESALMFLRRLLLLPKVPGSQALQEVSFRLNPQATKSSDYAYAYIPLEQVPEHFRFDDKAANMACKEPLS